MTRFEKFILLANTVVALAQATNAIANIVAQQNQENLARQAMDLQIDRDAANAAFIRWQMRPLGARLEDYFPDPKQDKEQGQEASEGNSNV